MYCDRRMFLESVGKGIGLGMIIAAFGQETIQKLEAASQEISHLSPEQAATDEDFWFEIQRAFTISRGIINLNNGGVCPSPRMVTEAVCRYTWEQEEAPVYNMWQILEPQKETIRTGLAELFGCDREEIAIVRNASEALEILLLGIELKPGDEVLTTTQDYPRMLTTLDQRARREGIKVRKIKIPTPPKNVDELVARFEEEISPRTKVILISHIVFLTGQIFPVKKICQMAKSRNIEVIVDGAHSFAHLDFKQKDLGCDYFGTSLHKWLLAPKGTGMLYVRKDKIGKIWPLMPAPEDMKDNIRKFEEIGTHPASLQLAIGDALAFHNGIGGKRKEARLRYLRDYWATKLKDVPNIRFHSSFQKEQTCALFNVEIEGIEPEKITRYLWEKHRIIVATIKHEEFQGIRVTPNVYTTLRELDRFTEIMEYIARRGLPNSA
ncbi:MAG: aminotransferase class V-fold PLP-dependent enzyme [Candidatus Aminicenantia bacterium]